MYSIVYIPAILSECTALYTYSNYINGKVIYSREFPINVKPNDNSHKISLYIGMNLRRKY